MRFAADALDREGLRLLIEPINTLDIPGFAISRTEQALDLLDEVGAGNTWLQYEPLHHAQRMVGEIAATLSRYLHRIAMCSWPATQAATSRARASQLPFFVRAPGPNW